MTTTAVLERYNLATDHPEQLSDSFPLTRALASLGVQPFSHASVQRYQQNLIQRHTRRRKLQINLVFSVFGVFLLLMIVAALLSLLIGIVWAWFSPTVPSWFFRIPVLAGVVIAVFCFFDLNLSEPYTTWLTSGLKDHRQPLPEAVDGMVQRLGKECPNAVFTINRLQICGINPEPVLAPILVVSLGNGEQFWLEVLT